MDPFKRTASSGAAAQVDDFNQRQRIARSYTSLPLVIAKQRAKAAFAAYDQALRDGDPELAEAARVRFLAASARLREGRNDS